jgi:anti-sigma B factor antagonist
MIGPVRPAEREISRLPACPRKVKNQRTSGRTPYPWGKSVEIGEQREDGILVLRPVGRINNDSSPDFQARLLAWVDSNDAVVIDLGSVEYISSAGLRALMMASRRAKARGGRIAVAALSPLVNEVFTISRFDQVVQVFDTAADARAAIHSART